MLGAAVFGAEQVIGSGARGMESDSSIATGKHVHLYAKGGNKKAMNDVLRNQRDLDIPADRHVQFVDLSLALWMLELPHPLLGRAIELQRIYRHTAVFEIDNRPPGK